MLNEMKRILLKVGTNVEVTECGEGLVWTQEEHCYNWYLLRKRLLLIIIMKIIIHH